MSTTIKSLAIVLVAILGIAVAGAVYYIWSESHLCGQAGAWANTGFISENEFVEVNGTGLYVMELGTGPNLADYDYPCAPSLITIIEVHLYLLDPEGNVHFNAVLGEIDVSFSGNDENWVSKAENVSKDNGTLFPVHFVNSIDESLGEKYSDSPTCDLRCFRHTYISKGDKIMVYGSGSEADGPASEGWKIKLKHTRSGDQIYSQEPSGYFILPL